MPIWPRSAAGSVKPATSRARTSRSNIAGRGHYERCRRWPPNWSAGRSPSLPHASHRAGARGQGGDLDDSDRVRGRRRPGQRRARCQPQPPGGNVTGVTAIPLDCGKAARAAAHDGADGRRIAARESDEPAAESRCRRSQEAAHAIGQQLLVVEPARRAMIRRLQLSSPAGAGVLLGADPFFIVRSNHSSRWRAATRFRPSSSSANWPRPAA